MERPLKLSLSNARMLVYRMDKVQTLGTLYGKTQALANILTLLFYERYAISGVPVCGSMATTDE
jgi:hypothetical protein